LLLKNLLNTINKRLNGSSPTVLSLERTLVIIIKPGLNSQTSPRLVKPTNSTATIHDNIEQEIECPRCYDIMELSLTRCHIFAQSVTCHF
jgi:hypothetical protein